MIELSHEQIMNAAENLANRIKQRTETPLLYGVPRGGIPAAYAVMRFMPKAQVVDDVLDCTHIIDDLVDSGKTRTKYFAMFPEKRFEALFDKSRIKGHEQTWFVFPWEESEDGSADDIPTRLLQLIGEDPNRGGLQETPRRFVKAWREYTSGYEVDVSKLLKTFEDGAEGVDEVVVVKNIPVYSQCEHHLAPFFGVAHVGYIPKNKIVGLSKLSRTVNAFARRLQVQERLTNQIANAINDNLDPVGVAVVLECRHLCMESRGISQQGHTTVTSAMRGAFLDKVSARAEFMELIK